MKHFFLSPWRKLSEEINPGNMQSRADETPETLYPFEHDPATHDGSNEFLNDRPKEKNEDLQTEAGSHKLVIVTDIQHNITDGCEFLDDAIRTFDQPLIQSAHQKERISMKKLSI